MARQTRHRQTRKQSRRHRKQRGGEGENAAAPTNVPPAPPASPAPPANNKPANIAGGKRKSRKLSPWNKFVKKVYHDMKAKDKSVTFSQALKEASKRKKDM